MLLRTLVCAECCDGTLDPGGAYAGDLESGTRIGIRLNRDGTAVVMDAISTAGFA